MTSSSGGRPACPPAPPPAAPSTTGRGAGGRGGRDGGRRDSQRARHGDYHATRGTARMRTAQTLVGVVGVALGACLVACTSSTARLPRVTFGTPDDRFETKMLRPAARASACRTSLVGIPIAGPSSPLESALRALLAM